MHRTPLSRTQWRTHARRGCLGSGTLEDRLARLGTSWQRTRPAGRSWRSFVHRPRSRLGHDHARRSRCCSWSGCLHLCWRSCGQWRGDNRRWSWNHRFRRDRDRGRRHARVRRGYRRRRGQFRRDDDCGRRTRCCHRSRSHELRRRRFDGRRWNRFSRKRRNGNFWLCSNGWCRRCRLDHRPWRRRLRGCFFLLDRSKNISRPRDVREIDLRLNLALGARRPGRLGRSGRLFRMSTKMLPDQDSFVLFQRTGVRLLLGDTHLGQDIENRLALDLQLACQIVDSNLAHPPSRCCQSVCAYGLISTSPAHSILRSALLLFSGLACSRSWIHSDFRGFILGGLFARGRFHGR